MMIDLTPSAERMTALLDAVTDDQLDRPTPCPDSSLGDLVDHVGTLTIAFTAKAGDDGSRSGPPPKPDAANLEAGWRERIARDLRSLAEAWQVPAAWEGMTSAGGIELPAEVAGLIALDELVVHGWDIAVSIGAPYDPSPSEIEAAMSFVTSFDAPRDGNLFGPVVPVPEGAAPLDRLLGLTGRDPNWQPPRD
jgi:uncharacterized protein (TIGR03086 family)